MTTRDLGGATAAHLQRNEQKWWNFVRIDVPAGPQYFTDHPNGDQVLNIDTALGSLAVGNPGSGYSTATIAIGAPNVAGGTQATATAVLSGGQLVGYTWINRGSGYTSNPSVTVTGNGTGATMTASVLKTWFAADVVVSGLSQGQNGALAVASIEFANLDYVWTNWANTVGLRNRDVTVWHMEFNDDGSLAGGWKEYVGRIDNQQLGETARLALKPWHADWAKEIPWAIPGPACIFPYKDSDTCQYTGAEPAGQATCGKTRADCVARGNQARFGGADFMPKDGEEIYWGVV